MTAWGKTPVRCADAPGFIVNRVNRPYTVEALRMLEAGVAPVEAIDAALAEGGFPIGPFELIDLTGVDINLAASRAIWDGLGRPDRLRPSLLLERLITDGRLGFPARIFEAQFLRLLRLKYQGRKIDLLMPVGPDTLRFAQRYRADIWPGVPIVFYSVRRGFAPGFQLQPEATGIILPFDLPGTIELAMRSAGQCKTYRGCKRYVKI